MTIMLKPEEDPAPSKSTQTSPSVPLRSRVEVRLVSTYEERQMVVAVRSAVYLGEEAGSYRDHFDENDHCSSLLLAMQNGEPVGTMRCRWYSDFARIEKLVVRRPFRRLSTLNALVEAALRLAVKKGYRTVSGIALQQIVPFWQRKGGFVPGEPFEMVYGTVVPLIGTPPAYPDIDPVRLELAGQETFERLMYQWEGVGL